MSVGKAEINLDIENLISIKERYVTLKNLILNNAKINYSKDDLIIDNETAIMEFMKAVEYEDYDCLLSILKDKEKIEDKFNLTEDNKDIATID